MRDVVDGQGRHDRHVVQRHAAAGRRGDRRRGARGDHSDRAEHVVLPLLPLERPRASSRRLARRGHRFSVRLRQQRRSGAARLLQHARIATACSREGATATTGDYNEFWARAICCRKSKNIKAAVLMAHAFNDWNVVPEHSVRIYEALKGRVPLQVYFHQGGHGGAPPLEMMNRWFTRYLYGVENGVEKEPQGVDRPRVESRRSRRRPAPERRRRAAVRTRREAPRRRRRRTPTIRIRRPSPVTLHLERRRRTRVGALEPARGRRRQGHRDARRRRRVQRRRARDGRDARRIGCSTRRRS